MGLISFIIPAHNEERLIGGTLAALEGVIRTLDEAAEVIVVDDSSSDQTAEIARQHGVRVVQATCRQIAGARNAGAREAKGEFFVFVDADTTVNETVVKAAVAAMRGGAAGGGCSFRFDGKVPLYARVMAPLSMLVFRIVGLASGCFLFCTRKAFEAVGGFDEQLFAAEEAVMSRALRRQGRFVVLRDQVTTSGRKLRTYSGWEILTTLLKLAITGPKFVRKREGLDIWYGERRKDPEKGP